MRSMLAFGVFLLGVIGAAHAQAQFQFQLGTRAQFMRQCVNMHADEEGPRSSGTRRACETHWVNWQSIGPMAATVLNAAAVSPGASLTVAQAQARLSGVRWDATPRERGLAATGDIGNLAATITQRNPGSVTFIWSGVWEEKHWEIERAFAVAGATVEPMFCTRRQPQSSGGAQSYRAFQITAPGRAPFAMVVGDLEGAYTPPNPIAMHQIIAVDLTGAPPTQARFSTLAPNARWGPCLEDP